MVVYLKSSFPKCVKRHSTKCACNANAKFQNYVLVKSFSHVHACIYVYIFMKSSFPTHNLRFWQINIATLIFGLALKAFLEQSSSFIPMPQNIRLQPMKLTVNMRTYALSSPIVWLTSLSAIINQQLPLYIFFHHSSHSHFQVCS